MKHFSKSQNTDTKAVRKGAQTRKFRNAARALECDESEEKFKRTLGALAKASKPKNKSKREPKK